MRNRLIVTLLLACSASLLHGIQAGIISAVLLFIKSDFPVLKDSRFLLSFVVSSSILGAFFGSLIFSRLSEQFGRRKCLLGIYVIFICASLCQSLAPTLWFFYSSRFLLGIGIGACTTVIPTYVSEITPASIRGKCGSFVQLSISFGIASSFVLGWALTHLPSDQWRYMLGLPGIIATIPLIFNSWICESPRWLARKMRDNEARVVMQSLGTVDEFGLVMESVSITTQNGSWRSLFFEQWYPLSLAIGLFLVQQSSGINVIVYFSSVIFEDMGFDKKSSLLLSAATSAPQLICLLIVAFTLDRRGRKPLLLMSLSMMSIFMYLLSFSSFQEESVKRWMSAAFIVGAKIAFSFGLGPIPTVLASESLPNHLRSKGMAVASMTNWITNGLISTTFLSLKDLENTLLQRDTSDQDVTRRYGSYVYCLYATVLVIGLIWLALWVRETAELRLEEVVVITPVKPRQRETATLLVNGELSKNASNSSLAAAVEE